jgi:hypothetical protein
VSQHHGYIGLRHSRTHTLSIDRPSPQHTVNSDGVTGTAAGSPRPSSRRDHGRHPGQGGGMTVRCSFVLTVADLHLAAVR